ncbi:hypothetical protein GBAR_LOCUS1321, partial [Geodia barretti]
FDPDNIAGVCGGAPLLAGSLVALLCPTNLPQEGNDTTRKGHTRHPHPPQVVYSDSTVLCVTLSSPHFSAHTQLVVEEERDNGVTRWPTTLAGTPATILTRLEEAEPAGEDITRE